MTTSSTVTADGTTSNFSVSFPYLDRTHVKVKLDGVAADSAAFSWLTAGSIKITPTPAAGVEVEIFRETPTVPLTTYQSGSVLTRDQLEVDSLQALYRVEELRDRTIQPEDFPELISELVAGGAAVPSSLVLAHTDSAEGAVTRTIRARLNDLPLDPKALGALGDGVADDSAALLAALSDAQATGRVIDLGDSTRNYRVAQKLEKTLTAPLRIRANGATITYDPPAATREAVLFLSDVHSVDIQGRLAVDANDKARIGVLVQNDGSRGGSVSLKDLEVRNVYRGNLTFTGGDGIMVAGPYDRVDIVRATVTNCRMASGAGVLGSQGIFGITVGRRASGAPIYTSIVDPYIDGVFSVDSSYEGDQDAIRVFGDAPGTNPSRNFFEVRGGYIGGHYGRGVKGQFNFGRVSGTKFYRGTGYASKVGGREIDFQYGGGTVRDIECLYENDFVPESIVQVADATATGYVVPSVTIDGVKVVNTGTTYIPYGFVQSKSTDDAAHLTIRNVEVRGRMTRLVQWWVRGLECTLTLDNILANPTVDWIFTRSTTLGVTSKSRILATNCHNTGADVPFITRHDSLYNLCEISGSDCYGFTDGASGTSTGATSAPFSRTHGIGAANDRDTGIFRPVMNPALADGAEWVLPKTARNGNSGIIMVTVGTGDIGAQAIFTLSNAGAAKFTGGGGSWTVGATSDPGSGSWRIWTKADGSGVVIKNASGTSRSVMAWMFG